MEKRIEAYSLVEFCQQIQEAVQEGFKIDFKDNASIPVGMTGYYRCLMHKGSKTAALLKPPADKESFEADLDKIEEKFVEFDGLIHSKQQESTPTPTEFVPSIVFEVKEPEKKPKGRPKASRV